MHVEKSILVSHGESNWEGSHNSASNPIEHIIGCLVSHHFHSKVIPFSCNKGTCVFFFSGFIIFVQIHIKNSFFCLSLCLRLLSHPLQITSFQLFDSFVSSISLLQRHISFLFFTTAFEGH